MVYEYLKIVDVINYYTLEIIIYNNNTQKFNKYTAILKDVDLLDEKLNEKERRTLKDFLESLLINKYMQFEICGLNNDCLNIVLFTPQDKTINSTLSNTIIKIINKKEIIKKLTQKYDIEEGLSFKKSLRYKKFDKSKIKILDKLEERSEL